MDMTTVVGGSHLNVALETADIVLTHDRLDQLPFLLQLSRRMVRTIRLNIWLSFGINCIAILAGATGLLTPIKGALTHNFGSVLVVSLAASIGFIKEKPEQ